MEDFVSPNDKPLAIDMLVRVYLNGELHSQDRHSAASPEALAGLIDIWAKTHEGLGNLGPVMVELEFLDEPDQALRYFRFGTDPQRMVLPVAVGEA